MDFLLQISYLVRSNEDSKSSELMEQSEALSSIIETMLPEEYNHKFLNAKKEAVAVIRLEEGKNCFKCNICGAYVAIPGTGALSGIPEGAFIDGKIVCKHCVWECNLIS